MKNLGNSDVQMLSKSELTSTNGGNFITEWFKNIINDTLEIMYEEGVIEDPRQI